MSEFQGYDPQCTNNGVLPKNHKSRAKNPPSPKLFENVTLHEFHQKNCQFLLENTTNFNIKYL